MAKNLGKRLLQTIIVLFCVSLLIFVLLRIVPGDAVTTMMGEHANAETIERLTKEMKLDQPVYIQFINYLKDICTGNFGTSYTLNKPVTHLLAVAFPNTVKLALLAAAIAWIIGIACGIIAAVKKNGILDRLFMGFSLLGVSVPVFMVAMLLQYLIAYKLHWVDISGVTKWTGYILPAIALGWNSAGSIARLTRSTLAEVLQEDYIDTARAKGRGRSAVILFHGLKNAMLPVITMMALQISSLLSGAVITETIFSINGIGRLAVDAISTRDIPLLQGTVLFTTVIVILGNLVADCLYAVLDPRIRKEV
ncbi:MAG: ABC transporter permease [Blautia sp.]|nr:ABC transporter permease [Clostridia bacterium]MDY4693335.1 ABC transporter permease [Blautia sp.]MDY5554290.1 ABC transporter permease [Blautia sp.]